MTPAERAYVEALERRVAALERVPVNGAGVSTHFGATRVSAVQQGFPAELTGAYEANGAGTGYPWKRMYLDPAEPGFVEPGLVVRGDTAFEAGGREDLTSGTAGWMEPAPDGSPGWVFVVSDGAARVTRWARQTEHPQSGALDVQTRQLNGSFAWANGPAYADVTYHVEVVDPAANAPGFDETGLLWPDPAQAGKYNFVTIMYAGHDNANVAAYPGLLSTTAQRLAGAKTWTAAAVFETTITVWSSAEVNAAADGTGDPDVPFRVRIWDSLDSAVEDSFAVFNTSTGSPYASNPSIYCRHAIICDKYLRLAGGAGVTGITAGPPVYAISAGGAAEVLTSVDVYESGGNGQIRIRVPGASTSPARPEITFFSETSSTVTLQHRAVDGPAYGLRCNTVLAAGTRFSIFPVGGTEKPGVTTSFSYGGYTYEFTGGIITGASASPPPPPPPSYYTGTWTVAVGDVVEVTDGRITAITPASPPPPPPP